MLFGVRLANSVYPPWKESYIQYEHLKELLKEEASAAGGDAAWSDKDESQFAEALDKELERVYSFQLQKYNGLLNRLKRLEEQTVSADKLQTIDWPSFQRILEESLSEAQELDRFARLNFTGFVKIVKKHDKLHRGYPSVKSLLEVRLKELPFHSEDNSPILYQISLLYSVLRNSNPSQLSRTPRCEGSVLSSITNSMDTEVHFRTFTFWVHRDNLMEVKTRILRHLPVLVYASAQAEDEDGAAERFDSRMLDLADTRSTLSNELDSRSRSYDPVISTVYFDNEQLELYNNKLLRANLAPTLRFRWVGKLASKPEIFLEKRAAYEHPDEAPEDFEVLRVELKPEYINGFVFHGDQAYKESRLRELKQRRSSDAILNATAESLDKLQRFIAQDRLQPVLRTVYTRTAFQIPGDDRVRITIDSDILYVREDAFDKDRPIRKPTEWHRADIDADVPNPLKLLRPGEYSKFPYSVMEIKIKNPARVVNGAPKYAGSLDQLLAGAKVPERHGKWISELADSHLVREVPRFSRYVQGIASLFGEDDRLDVLPFWLPDLETDIRQKPGEAYEEERLKLQKQQELQKRIRDIRRLSRVPPEPYTAVAKTGGGSAGQNKKTPDADIDERGSSSDEDAAVAGGHRARGIPSSNRAAFFKILTGRDAKLRGVDSEDEEEVELPPGVKKPATYLKNVGPNRVEAKVWLANERTFNRWLQTTTLLSAVTFSIHSSVRRAEFPRLADGLAYAYFALTVFCGLWAYYTYTKRLEVIQQRSGRHLDAPLGPIIVVLALSATLVINFVVAFREAAQTVGVAGSSSSSLPAHLVPVERFIFKLVGA